MPEEFEIKKISQETLGEYLKAIREQQKLSLAEVAQTTGVLEKFIEAIEQGKYQILPPDAYVVGFLKKLATAYSISCEDLLEQFHKEKDISVQADNKKLTPPKGFRAFFAELSVTPKLISVSVGLLLGVSAFSYVLFQVFSVNRTPELSILEPTANTVLSGSSITFKGKTEPGVSVSVNGQNVMVKSDGGFETTLGAAPGQKDFQVVATNKFGKERVESFSLRVEEPKVAGEATQQPSEIVLELQFARNTTINIVQDGVELPEETVPAGATKKIIAQDLIELTTSDAGGTQVSYNGSKLGSLGKSGERITVPFTKAAQEILETN